MNRKRGRPPPTFPREYTVLLKLTEAEKRTLEETAKRLNLSKSGVLRKGLEIMAQAQPIEKE